MRLFLDTEFNGNGGELISIGIVADNGAEFYVVVATPDAPHPWVKDHVLPFLNGGPGVGRVAACHALQSWLRNVADGRPFEIIADWPEDFAHFFALLVDPERPLMAYMPPMLAVLTRPPRPPVPEVPHNALSDAIALRKAFG